MTTVPQQHTATCPALTQSWTPPPLGVDFIQCSRRQSLPPSAPSPTPALPPARLACYPLPLLPAPPSCRVRPLMVASFSSSLRRMTWLSYLMSSTSKHTHTAKQRGRQENEGGPWTWWCGSCILILCFSTWVLVHACCVCEPGRSMQVYPVCCLACDSPPPVEMDGSQHTRQGTGLGQAAPLTDWPSHTHGAITEYTFSVSGSPARLRVHTRLMLLCLYPTREWQPP